MKPLITNRERVLGPATFLALVAAAIASPAVHLAGAAIAAPQQNVVQIKNFAFASNIMKVKAGTTVTWTNNDQMIHNVVARDNSFRSKFLAKGESFTFKFTKKGEFAYYCALHPQMVGKIVVS